MKTFFLLHLSFVFFLYSATAQTIQIKLTLSGNPSSVELKKTKLKYGKEGAFCLIYDDRASTALDALSIMPSHTDGANNAVKYKATIASNAVTYTGDDFSANGALTLQQLKKFIDEGWALACHGYYHGVPANMASQGFTVDDNVRYNRQYHYNNLRQYGTEYILRTRVVPSNDGGYHNVWDQYKYLAGTSQGVFDIYTAIPQYEYINNGVGDISNLNNQYYVFARRFTDLVNQSNTNDALSYLNTLISQSSAATPRLLVLGTHITQNTYLSQVLNHIKNTSNDRIWVPSFQELMEYNETLHKTTMSYSVNGNQVIITLQQNLPDATRWRDISLQLISDKQIVSIESTGADLVNYNASTGLINMYRKKTSGFAAPDNNSVLPVKFTLFKGSYVNGNIFLNWITTDNQNVIHYEVEKSTNGIRFTRIATTTLTSYRDQTTDHTQYYRIKAVERDQRAYHSQSIKVASPSKQAQVTYIKGIGARIELNADKDESSHIHLYSTDGKLIYRKEVRIRKGINIIYLPDVGSEGVHFINVQDEKLRYVK